MRRLKVAVLAALAMTALIAAPAGATKYVVPRPASVKAMAPPAKVEGVQEAAELNIQYQVQETGYWCGPAATRIALSARTGDLPSQQQLANELPTTTNGTDWIGQVTRVLSGRVGWYETKEMPNDPPTQAQRDLLWRDIVLDINNGYAIVANIVAPPNNHPPGYPNETIYHYFTVIGYDSSNWSVKIADPANFGGNQLYWLSFDQLASLIPPKGYSA
ncbi:Peptidase_C39 like family protein [Amycolatopsis xylanica]|uniref:Peptidase_C39 like family protein n=1 Tax=Amycolatopsis xylanica TaxID=589385 RepID=A0A1H3JMK1_9PSEU|nr:C39 family peptidase [Amycolatopsis xylanica]SDY40765.1 Peptidase_C39 like family protein [Amycolatopsis xylanica]